MGLLLACEKPYFAGANDSREIAQKLYPVLRSYELRSTNDRQVDWWACGCFPGQPCRSGLDEARKRARRLYRVGLSDVVMELAQGLVAVAVGQDD